MAGLEATVKLAVVGVPGQGKSTFLNLISGEEDDAFAVGCGNESKTKQTQWGGASGGRTQTKLVRR